MYRYVIDDVINQVRGDFEDMGIDESILQELQRVWKKTNVVVVALSNYLFSLGNQRLLDLVLLILDLKTMNIMRMNAEQT